MIYLEVIGETKNTHFSLNLNSLITVIGGDSATGKSLLYNLLNKTKCKELNTNASTVIQYTQGIPIDCLKPNSLVVIESDSISIDVVKEILYSGRTDIFILYLGRKYIKSLPISADDLYRFEDVQGVTKNIKCLCSRL